MNLVTNRLRDPIVPQLSGTLDCAYPDTIVIASSCGFGLRGSPATMPAASIHSDSSSTALESPVRTAGLALRQRLRLRCSFALFVGLVFSHVACDPNQINVCLDENSTIEISPSGRAIAIIDPQAYDSILNAPPDARPNFNCAVDGYIPRFDPRPEALIFVLDMEDRFVTRARLMHQEGFRLFSDVFEDLTDEEIIAYGAAQQRVQSEMEQLPSPPASAFNISYRQLESGTGNGTSASCSESCPEFVRGYVFLPTRDDLPAGRFLHEFAHFWGAHLTGPAPLANQIEASSHHWGFTSVGGILGGWHADTLEEIGGGRFVANVASHGRASNQFVYAPLELYLMGLAPQEEVDPIQVAVGVEEIRDEGGGRLSFQADRLETITIRDIIEANGARTPRFGDSPSQFSVGLVIIASAPIANSVWSYYESVMDFLEADADADLLQVFSESEYPAHYEVWSFFSKDGEEPYLNFSKMTGSRGSLRFVPAR